MNSQPTVRPLNHRRDALLMAAVIVIVAAVAIHFDLSEWLFQNTRRLEFLQLDESPLVLFAMATGFAWYSYRRLAEAKTQLVARREVEATLQATLLDLRRLANERLASIEAERRAIARDLHDDLGQHLTALKLDVALLPPDRQGMLPDARDRIIGNIHHLQQVVRVLIGQLRPVGLDELGLAAAIEHLAGTWRERAPNCALEIRIGDGLESLDGDRRLTAYRVVQEGLTNAFRHAEATRIEVCVQRGDDGDTDALRITITDDGRGVPPDAASHGVGLRGMRERVEGVGGQLNLRIGQPRGCILQALLPARSAA